MRTQTFSCLAITNMKRIFLQGLLWLYLFGFGYMALALEPGYLDFDNLPDTNFSCVGKVIGGYYADLETNCQMFHVCTIGQLDEPMDIRFLCLNGTVFDQETRVCERIDEVDCSKSEQFYSLNLELYGNTQPSILEESPETEPPFVKSSTTTTTTTTQRPQKPIYFTTITTVSTASPKVVSTHHFPVSSNSPDIRFNPEEINISLNPGAPPNIRQKPLFHYSNEDPKDTTQQPKTVISYDLNHNKPATPRYYFHQQEERTENLPQYHYHHQFRPHPYANQFKTTTFHPQTTRKHVVTTYRSPFVTSSSFHNYRTDRTEKPPQRLQLPLPLRNFPPLQFSSPAPFTLSRHIETKRYTDEHQSPPRIIISASASVSDASGRRLNYSLGTIGAAHLLEAPPASYDEYKDHDVGLDPFYHDVPKLKNRSKRNTRIKHSDVIKNEQEAVDVLKFLFDWYRDHEKSKTTVSIPLVPETITEINQKLSPSSIELPLDEEDDEKEYNFRDSDLFRSKSKFNIVGDILSITEKSPDKYLKKASFIDFRLEDYVDDNYEPLTYKETNYKLKENETFKNETNFIPLENGETLKNITEHGFEESTENYHILPKEFSEETTINNFNQEITTLKNIIEETTTIKPKNRHRGRGRFRYNYGFNERKKIERKNKPFRYITREITTQTAPVISEIEATTKVETEISTKNGTERIQTETIKEQTTETEVIENFTTEKIMAKTEEVTTENARNIAINVTPTEDNYNIVQPKEKQKNKKSSGIEGTTQEPNSKGLNLKITDEDNYYAKTKLEETTENYKTTVEKPKSENEIIETTMQTITEENYHLININVLKNVEETTLKTEETTKLQETTPSTINMNSEIYLTIPTDPTFQKTTLKEKIEEIEFATKSVAEINLTPLEIATKPTKEVEVTSEVQLTSAITLSPKRRKTRPSRPRTNNGRRRPYSKHRFSTDAFTSRPNGRRKPKLQSSANEEEVASTDAPLFKSANPTQAENAKISLHTTPLSLGLQRKFIFNCFGRTINKFYSDPRDCRLFHYCTSGYNKNQLLDMKFVCDLGTYFDDEKLICTKDLPGRCL